jgi:hypothetical protein
VRAWVTGLAVFASANCLYSNKIDFSIATGLQTRCYGKIALFFKKPLNFEYKLPKNFAYLAYSVPNPSYPIVSKVDILQNT